MRRRARIGYANWGAREYCEVLAGCAGLRGDAPVRLRNTLSDMGYGDVILSNRATTGLRLALTAMRQRHPDRLKLVIPAYCCPSVPRVAEDLGLTTIAAPIGADLNLDTAAAQPLLQPDVLAVVGIHMYGAPLDIDALAAAAGPNNIAVIDDAAHVLGDTLGTRGDVGLISFNQSKTLAGGSPNGGGALLVNSERFRADIAQLAGALMQPISRLRHHLWFAFAYDIDPLPMRLPNYAARLSGWIARILGARHDSLSGISTAAAAAVMAQMDRLEAIRTGRARVLAAYAAACGEQLSMVQLATGAYRTRMIVRWQGGRTAADVQPMLTDAGISTRRLYPPWSQGAADLIGDRLDRHLELPGDLRMREADVAAVMRTLSRLAY